MAKSFSTQKFFWMKINFAFKAYSIINFSVLYTGFSYQG